MPDKRQSPENIGLLWIVVGDIHDETGNFAKIPELVKAAGIIVTGDLTQFGGAKEAKKVLEAIGESGLPVLAQIHTVVRELAPGIAIFGIGASTPTPFNTPSEFPEKTYSHWLKQEWDQAGKYPSTVLVSHNPPKDTVCDYIPEAGIHVGSVAVREFLEQNQPDICLCGHIHEGRGLDHVGRTLVVNPGTLASGGYAVMTYADGKLSAALGQV